MLQYVFPANLKKWICCHPSQMLLSYLIIYPTGNEGILNEKGKKNDKIFSHKKIFSNSCHSGKEKNNFIGSYMVFCNMYE